MASGAISGSVGPFELSAARNAALAVLLGNFLADGGGGVRTVSGLRSMGAEGK